jgi:hypothetical protein
MFGTLMFEAWVAAGRPHYAAVARETSRALIPLTEEQVKGFVEGDAVPASSYQIDAVLASLESYSEFDIDGYRPLIMASWGALSNVSTEKPPETTGAGFEGISNILDHVVEVATYLGAAGAGGIIGNRADAATVRSVKELFTRVRERWLSRKPEQDKALSRDEASDAARAVAGALGYPLESLSVRTAEQREKGSWVLILGNPDPPCQASPKEVAHRLLPEVPGLRRQNAHTWRRPLAEGEASLVLRVLRLEMHGKTQPGRVQILRGAAPPGHGFGYHAAVSDVPEVLSRVGLLLRMVRHSPSRGMVLRSRACPARTANLAWAIAGSPAPQ